MNQTMKRKAPSGRAVLTRTTRKDKHRKFGYSSQDTMQLKNVIAHDLNEMDILSKKWLMSFNPDKTEIMIFSNRSVPENLDFSFNGKSVPITTSHTHLGVTFSNDAKWNNHVDNIKSSVSKHLNILRKLKYRLSRTNLDKLYLVCIRPLLNMHVNYGIPVGLEIHKNWNNFNWKLPELLQAYLFLPKLRFYIERQVGNYYLRDGREGNFNFFII